MSQQEIKKIAEAIRRHIPDAKILLFGSRARGDNLTTSDIDLIVISKTFQNTHFTRRAAHILKILHQEHALPRTDIDILCYTPQELHKKKNEIGTIQHALKHAKEI